MPFSFVLERDRRRVEELAPEMVAAVELFVEGEVAVLPVGDHGAAEPGEVEPDLVHPAGLGFHPRQRRF